MAEPPEPTSPETSPSPSSPPTTSSSPGGPSHVSVEISTTTVVTVLAAVSALLLVISLVRSAPEALTLIAIGAFAGLALDPLVTLSERRLRLTRGWSAALVLLVLTIVTVAFLGAVGPQLAKQTTELPDQLPDVVDSLTDLPIIGPTLAENDVPAKVQDWLGTLPERLAGPSSNLAGVVESIGSGMLKALLALAVMVGLVLDGPMLVARARSLIPSENRPRADQLGQVAYAVIARYFVGNLFLSVLHGVWVAIWGTALGVPLTPVLAVWAAITSLIPQIGGLLGFVLIVAVSLTQGIGVAIIMGVAFGAYMTFDNNVLLPIFVGRAIDVSAPVTMLGAIAGFAVAGVAGSLLAIPIIGAVKAMAMSVRYGTPPPAAPAHPMHSLRERWQRRRGRGSGPPPSIPVDT
ncbi:MAG TPA: AI-2E family transporter [Acidimicrobiales bacterium]